MILISHPDFVNSSLGGEVREDLSAMMSAVTNIDGNTRFDSIVDEVPIRIRAHCARFEE
jgi:hypothetical protein